MGWEIDQYDLTDCPCGEGKIVLERHSPDNGWSRPYDTTKIACPNCEKLWDINYGGDTLTQRASQNLSRLADAEASAAERKVVEYLGSILPNYGMPTFKTMGAEFEYLHASGLYGGRVGQYRRARRTASMIEIAEIRSDSAIVPILVDSVGSTQTYEALVAGAKAAKDVAAERSKAVIRMRIPNTF